MITPKNCVEIRDLSFGWNNNSHRRIIFDNVNIDVQLGKITAIMGPSGSGKTTLLRLIGGQLVPDQGRILVNGENIPDLNRTDLYRIRRQMGMLFQSGALFSDLSVFENVAFPLREHTKLSEGLIRDIVLMKLQAVGLRGACDLMPSELSGGMQRRAALARTIALDPTLIMYDEPFAGQDPISMGVLLKLIRLLNDALSITSIIVSHDVVETASIADYIYVIAQGRVVGHGTPIQIKEHSSAWVQQFMKGLPDGPVPFHYPAPAYLDDLIGERS
ncbi:MAG: ATP-binding cassette domain-containing protein [Proteobacteria bacterium]|nr:ATP-binding cassette domain-containing protein [Pseudomonadota bacterium]